MRVVATSAMRGYTQNQLHLRDFGSQGEFSPASANVVVGENPKTLHQPLTWADRKGNTEPAPPTPLENPYMGVKDYDTWSNQCENEFLKDMDEYKVDPTTKPFPVVKQVEWATLFTNSRWPFQYTEQCPPECKPDIYTWDHASIARHWDKYGAPHFYSTNYMRLPTMYSMQMPYIGYISCRIDDPPLPASLDMISSSDGVKLTDAYRKQLEDFVLRNCERYRQWCLTASNLGIQVSLATLITPVKPQSLGKSPFSVHLLSQSMPDELAMTQLASDYLRCAYEYGAFAWMTMHWCIDHISTVVWLDDLQAHGVPLWGLWFDDAGIDIKSMQHLTGKEISQEELDPILKEKGNNVHYHTVSEQLIVESDCLSPWFIVLRSYPGVPPHKALEDIILDALFLQYQPRPPEEMCQSLRNIVGDGPFLPPSHYASSSAAHFSEGVTCDMDEALEAEPWFSPDNDEEEAAQEEEDALDRSIQPRRGESNEDFEAWREVEIIKFKKRKQAAQAKMDVAWKEANELMQRALKGNKSALADVKSRLKGASGKKKGKLSDFDACILEGWRDPNSKTGSSGSQLPSIMGTHAGSLHVDSLPPEHEIVIGIMGAIEVSVPARRMEASPTEAMSSAPASTEATPSTPAPTGVAPSAPVSTEVTPSTPVPTGVTPSAPVSTEEMPSAPAPTGVMPSAPVSTEVTPSTPPTGAVPSTPVSTDATPTALAPTGAMPSAAPPIEAMASVSTPTETLPIELVPLCTKLVMVEAEPAGVSVPTFPAQNTTPEVIPAETTPPAYLAKSGTITPERSESLHDPQALVTDESGFESGRRSPTYSECVVSFGSPSPSHALSPHRSLNPHSFVLFLPHLPAHILNLPRIPARVLDLPHILAHILPPPYVSRHVRNPHCILAHTHPLPHIPAHVLGIPLSPKGENLIIPSPKRTIIIIKNAIILWVPHSLIDGLRGLQWTHLTGPNATFSVSGPTQPISGWVGTTTSSAVAKGSHVNLMSSFQSIPLGRWFAIIAGPLPNDGFCDIQLWLDVYPQVVAVRREWQKSRFSMQLLFKTQQIHDKLKTLVSSWATLHGVDIRTTTMEEPSGPSERFTGQKDLEYVDQVYAHARNLDELNALLQGAPLCIKGGAERAHYGEFFLHYDTFPPLSGAAPPKAKRLCHLDCVEFSTEWFLTCLARLQDHVDLPLRCMEMLICAHKYHSLGAGFAVPMWPTEGPVDAVIRHISRMGRDDMGSILTPNPVANESFGFTKSSSIWHIKLDLGLDRPQYPKSE
ncbi:hypothetical protein BS47DRAFT_1386991 [Hydnum rufescens UP504]|uniref:Uncharacterized protein n=1 Tax=Hydnum rufescens UP504 TaxID=1448309 RepID=A0A9P6E0N7_9AGAM|nr:hypothetical protein BS47DRAFT_1386991 [Hydnum rufescens UP504]